MTWNYKTVVIEPIKTLLDVKQNTERLQATLEQEGAEGWELVSTLTSESLGTTGAVTLIFKRPRA